MGRFYNLSEDEREFAKKRTKFCIIIYDIVSNKRRLQFSKMLEDYGVRVQRSCFEVDLEQISYEHLLKEIEDCYDAREDDNILLYVTHREEVIR